MSRADHDQHRRDIDGIHTDMALLDEDLNSRVDILRNTVDSDRIDVIARIDALESTINTRFDDINDLGENTDHEVELLKARVSALESATGADHDDTGLRFAKLEERQRETAEYVNTWVGEFLVRLEALESIRTQDDTIHNEFKGGDRVIVKVGLYAPTEGDVVEILPDMILYPIRVRVEGSSVVSGYSADELRHADACQNRTESGTELADDDPGFLASDECRELLAARGTAQEAQGMAWVDLEEERTYRKIAEDKRTEANQAKWVAEARVKELESQLSDLTGSYAKVCLDLSGMEKRSDYWQGCHNTADGKLHDAEENLELADKELDEYRAIRDKLVDGLDKREAQIQNQYELIVATRERADAWSSVARGLARQCAEFRYHERLNEQWLEKIQHDADAKERELGWWLRGAQEKEVDARQERDEARETAYDLAVDYDSAMEELGAVWRERVSYARKLEASQAIADEWKDRALKAESDVVNADLAQSRAASEKRIDPARRGGGNGPSPNA